MGTCARGFYLRRGPKQTPNGAQCAVFAHKGRGEAVRASPIEKDSEGRPSLRDDHGNEEAGRKEHNWTDQLTNGTNEQNNLGENKGIQDFSGACRR